MSFSVGSVTSRFLPCLAVLALWVAAGAQPADSVGLPEDLHEKCVAHEFNVPGQGFYISGSGFYISGSGFYISGSAGGMVRGDITFVDPQLVYPNTTLLPRTVGQVTQAIGVPSTGSAFDLSMDRDVMLVVADDFAGGSYQLPTALRDPAASTVTLAELAHLVSTGEFSHGALVMHHVNAAIADLRVFRALHDPSLPEMTIWEHETTGKHLIVVGLDLGGFVGAAAGPRPIGEDEVFDALNGGLEGLIGKLPSGLAPEALVVNLSWVLLPCATVQAFLDNIDTFQTFEEYVAGVAVISGPTDFESVVKALNQSTDPELQSLLDVGRRPNHLANARFVAAAGNFSLQYQMLPAAFSQVVGVAVSPVTRAFPDRYSNAGDVHIPGEWVTFQALDETGALGPETSLSYAGTSYASPLVALHVALDEAGAMRCVPPAGQASPLITTTTSGDPADIALVEAINGCP